MLIMIRIIATFILAVFSIPISGISAQAFLSEVIEHDGETRLYDLYVPSSYEGEALPLLFNFHGGNGDIASQVTISDMRDLADTNGLFLVYPQALEDPNDDGSTNWLHKDPTEVDDVFLIEAIIEAVSNEYEIDSSRIYATGYSLGGEFTYELACRLNDKIAAVVAVARTMGTAAFDNCSPVHPTGVMTILGTEDSISPYDGLTWEGVQYYLSADEMHNYWVDYNNCSSEANVIQIENSNPNDGSTVERLVWEDGDNCVSVEQLKVIGGGHDWPGSFGNMDINADEEIWNFVSRFSLNGMIDCEGSSISNTQSYSTSFTVKPNPFNDHLLIENVPGDENLYYVYNVHGELIRSSSLESGPQTIDLSGLAENVYFLKIGTLARKILKAQ